MCSWCYVDESRSNVIDTIWQQKVSSAPEPLGPVTRRPSSKGTAAVSRRASTLPLGVATSTSSICTPPPAQRSKAAVTWLSPFRGATTFVRGLSTAQLGRAQIKVH